MDRAAGEHVHTVAELNRMARLLLEQDLPALWIGGEISNFARPASGHLYFSLKDERAQVRCAMFRSACRGLTFSPANGQQVLLRARVTLYEPRGEFQLVVEYMEPAGEGLLLRKLEQLKQALALEGLFDAARKRPLPTLPATIGVITSPTGAAIRDILHILRRRFPAVPVVVYPVQVQGDQAKFDIVRALAIAAERAECDVLILARGGGSLEDLWAFNEEMVARAICACPIPVVSGVGHEIDFTIADLAADVRAPTPSGAAELVVPDVREWLRRLQLTHRQATLAALRGVHGRGNRLTQLSARLERCSPAAIVRQNTQRHDELRQRLWAALRHRLTIDRLRLERTVSRMLGATPAVRLRLARSELERTVMRLRTAMATRTARAGQTLAVLSGRLNTVSPLATLERGYAIVQDTAGRVLRDPRAVRPGERIIARLAEGSLEARVLGPGAEAS